MLPEFSIADAERIARDHYELTAIASPLASERDQNFLMTIPPTPIPGKGGGKGERFVLKIANAGESRQLLEMQNRAMTHVHQRLAAGAVPITRHNVAGELITTIAASDADECDEDGGAGEHFVRLVTWVDGELLADVQPAPTTLFESLGRFLGDLDNALGDFEHRAACRKFHWDLGQASNVVASYLSEVETAEQRALMGRFLDRFQNTTAPLLAELPRSVIHNDANDRNIIVRVNAAGAPVVTGIIDFGDMVYTNTVCEVAIGAAYAILGRADPLETAVHVLRGYHRVHPLADDELRVLWDLICMRLCLSVTIAAHQRALRPDNAYLAISERPAWQMLALLARMDVNQARRAFEEVCGSPPGSPHGSPHGSPGTSGTRESLGHGSPRDATVRDLITRRARYIGPSLSLAYRRPLKIVRGAGQYLYDHTGRSYLDCVNNVCHVGHCHPHVVGAAQRQMATLNTNTRYLHDNLVEYAERLTATMPDPLEVCYFVCSGSEANELALRLARTHTGGEDIICVDGAYHGNTGALIDISPYKFGGAGGAGGGGVKPHVHVVPTPDVYRGEHRDSVDAGDAGDAGDPGDAGRLYAEAVRLAVEKIRATGKTPAAFICESLLGCAGQIVLPDDYLRHARQHARDGGAVLIADEVQVGLGRVGSDMWGFQTQQVVPDIVTLGKPIGNGHPLGAVVTTREIAASFDNGMEYFNTFGGNPVSCAIGLAVLEVMEQENLQQRALEIGGYLHRCLTALGDIHPIIGDVRGLGLFLGIELVRDRETLEPAAEEAALIVETIKDAGILLSTDGPLHNVIKIKPPMVFTQANADEVADALNQVLHRRGW